MPTIRVPFSRDITYLPTLEVYAKAAFIHKTFWFVMREWFMEHGYSDLTGDSLLYFVERIYVEKRFQDRDIRSRWRVQKDVNYRFGNNYLKQFIDVDLRCVDLHDEEVMVEGKKIKALKGEVRLEIRGRLEVDEGLGNDWGKGKKLSDNKLLGPLNTFFRKRLYKQELEMHRKELYRDVLKFNGMIKKFFDLHVYLPEFEVFHKRLDTI